LTDSTSGRANRCEKAIEAGLRESEVLVALLDAESPSKPNLFFELGAAIGMGKRVVPIIPKGLDPSILPWMCASAGI